MPNFLQAAVTNFFNEWQIRVAVLLSLLLQTVLIAAGNRRKYATATWIRFILWLSYLTANSVATVSLSILSKYDKPHDSNYVMAAFWAPFLLVHLGGPDTITAFALEDNELWLRYLLGLFVQFGVALNVFIRSWDGSPLNYLSIPIFVAGMVKYGERTWVLRSASRDHFRDAMLPPPDRGPNYSKFMEEYSSKQAEGYKISTGTVTQLGSKVVGRSQSVVTGSDAADLDDAYYFFKTFKRLFADLILSFQDREQSQSFFTQQPWSKAFAVIEIELGFMYDLLYTKASLTFSRLGMFLRFISFSSTVSAFIAFTIIEKHKYATVQVSITYVLVIGAIALEFYAIIMLLSADWTMVWLSGKRSKRMYQFADFIRKGNLILQFCHMVPGNKRWSNLMAQYNLISFCLKDKPAKFPKVQKCLQIYDRLEKHRYVYRVGAFDGMKESIFKQIQEKANRARSTPTGTEGFMQFLKESIFEQILEKTNRARSTPTGTEGFMQLDSARTVDQVLKDELGWSNNVKFDQCILLWHVATTLCYNADCNDESDLCKVSKVLSNYMLYLLVMHPYMLPNGIGKIRFQDTCAEATDFFQESKSGRDKYRACVKLLEVNTDVPPSLVKGDRSKSVLFNACRLAKALRSLPPGVDKWEVMSCVWVELLCYTAGQCRSNYHAQQLRRGGELLTHVWLLMAHLGVTDHFQIAEGHARAKLLVS